MAVASKATICCRIPAVPPSLVCSLARLPPLRCPPTVRSRAATDLRYGKSCRRSAVAWKATNGLSIGALPSPRESSLSVSMRSAAKREENRRNSCLPSRLPSRRQVACAEPELDGRCYFPTARGLLLHHRSCRRLRAWPGGGGGGARSDTWNLLLCISRRHLRAWPGGGCGEAAYETGSLLFIVFQSRPLLRAWPRGQAGSVRARSLCLSLSVSVSVSPSLPPSSALSLPLSLQLSLFIYICIYCRWRRRRHLN